MSVAVFLFLDHIAVSLFILGEVSGLTLHLPCEWDSERRCFLDTGENDWRKNPGHTANKLHRAFSQELGESSLEQIHTAILLGAVTEVHRGFHERNTRVAQCSDNLIAFTWGLKEPVKGGTFDTWKKCSGRKEHVSLVSLAGRKRSASDSGIPASKRRVQTSIMQYSK